MKKATAFLTGMILLFAGASLSAQTSPDPLTQADIPEGISPNGDGLNDRWIIDRLADFPENELLIFNRWGRVVFREAPYENKWEGHSGTGERLPEGAYYYSLTITSTGQEFKGYIVINR